MPCEAGGIGTNAPGLFKAKAGMWLRYFSSKRIVLLVKMDEMLFFKIIASAKIYNLMKSLDSVIYKRINKILGKTNLHYIEWEK